MRIWLKPTRRVLAVVTVALLVGFSLPVTALASSYSVVTFAENDTSADSVVASQSSSTSEALTSFSLLTPALTNPGHVFVNWNTANNGSGTSYSDGAVYSFSSNLILYAQWSTNYSSVTFAENDSVSDSIVAQQTANSATSLTLFANLNPAFVKSGYTFLDWSANQESGGVAFADGAVYSFASNMTLYAQWTPNSVTTTTTTTTTTTLPVTMVTISFNDGGGTGVLNPVSVASGSSVQLPLPGSLTYQGFTQTGWFTAPSGGAFVGIGGTSVVPTSSMTLYAQWVPSSADVVTFSANGATGTVAPISAVTGSTVTLPSGAGLVNAGFTFAGWSTASGSSPTVYAGGTPYVVSGPVTLYATWTKTPVGPIASILAGSVGPFPLGSAVLGPTIKAQIHNIASGMKTRDYASASMFGYSLANEKGLNTRTLSGRRATAVTNYLRGVLVALHIRPVVTHAMGEGSVKGTSNAVFRRVEIFLKL
jgi:hypothetical protein